MAVNDVIALKENASGSFDQIVLTAAYIVAEPAFSKNTAFNKNYGTTSTTVCRGNDSRLSDARTPTTHNHDSLYYTETETNTLLGSKAVKITLFTQTSLTINCANGNFGIIELSANASYSLSNVPTGEIQYQIIKNSGGSTITITLPNTSDVKARLTEDIGAGKTKEFAFIYDGTTRYWQVSEILT